MPSFSVTIPLTFDNELTKELISCFLLHIIYVRSLIPQGYSDIQKEVDILKVATKLSMSEKKMLKSISYIEEVLLYLNYITKSFSISTFSILMGPSPNNAKEIYNLHFRPATTTAAINIIVNSNDQGKLTTNRQIFKAKRSLIQKLIEHKCNVTFSTTYKTCVFVALRVMPINVKEYLGNSLATLTDVSCPKNGFNEIRDVTNVFNLFSYRDSLNMNNFNKTKMEKMDVYLLNEEEAAIVPIEDVRSKELKQNNPHVLSQCFGGNNRTELCNATEEKKDCSFGQNHGVSEAENRDCNKSELQMGVVDLNIRWLILKKGIRGFR